MPQTRGRESASFAVHAEESALQRSSKGSITGPLFVVVGGHAFPEQGWSDLPVVVLEWWIRGLLALLQTGGPTEGQLRRQRPSTARTTGCSPGGRGRAGRLQ